VNFVKAIASIYGQGFEGKLFHIFTRFIPLYRYFRRLHKFLDFLNRKRNSTKWENTCTGRLSARGLLARHGHGHKSATGHGARCMVGRDTAWSPRCGHVLDGMVARPTRFAGGFPSGDVDGESITVDRRTSRGTSRASGLTVEARRR
jgi:hypothetical protein